MSEGNNPQSHGPVLLAQAGRDSLVNFKFLLEAPWKACRLCGTVYQSDFDRLAYFYAHGYEGYQVDTDLASYYERQGKLRRDNWLVTHNKYSHPDFFTELRQLEQSGLPVTPKAASKLSTYGIIPMGPTPYEDEISAALFEAPRAPVNDAEGT